MNNVSETKYISEKNNMTIEIRQTESLIKRSEETIKRLKQQEKSDFNSLQIKKLEAGIIEYNNKLLDLNDKYERICKGTYIPEIKEQPIRKQEIAKKKHVKISPQKPKETFKQRKYHDNEFSSNFLQKQTNKFFDICNTIPDYMKENLRNMARNKGYFWKGIACYGEKPQDSNTITLFEKRGNIMKIHEWTNNMYIIYEKVDKNQKQIIYQKERFKL